MKQGSIVLLWLAFSFGLYAQNSLESVRKRFENAVSEEDFEWIVQSTLPCDNYIDQNIINSYKAVSQSALAQYVFSPYTKFKYFFSGKDQLEQCISVHKNVENVFLRLVVQLSIPEFLGYSENIEEDLRYLTNNVGQSNISLQTKRFIVDTLIKTENSKYDLKSLLNIHLE